jgi:hypothetical protein
MVRLRNPSYSICTYKYQQCPTVELQQLFQTSRWDPGTEHRGAVHRPRGGGAPC